MMRGRFWGPIVGLVLCVTAASGQQDPLAALQQKATLTDNDRAALEQSLRQKVAATVREQGPAAGDLLRQLRRIPADATDAYREAYIASCIAAIDSAVSKAPEAAAARLLTVLYEFDDVATAEVYLKAVSDQRDPVRLCGAAGLRRLGAKLAAQGVDRVRPMLNALRDAGGEAQSVAVLDTIYRAMDLGNALPADAKVDLLAIIDLLETRSERYAAGQVRGEGIDGIGLAIVTRRLQRLNDTEKQRLMKATARMLRHTVAHYANDAALRAAETFSLQQVRNRIERFIEQAEQTLVQLGAGGASPPSITDAMQGEGDAVDMKISMNRWAELLEERTGEDYRLSESEPAAADAGRTAQ